MLATEGLDGALTIPSIGYGQRLITKQRVIVGVIGVSVPSVAQRTAINNVTAMRQTNTVSIELCHLHS